ncbi:ABC transporter substrate-binding protein [Chromobacterium sp. IIBBL 290-4]|uniref:substrate-binding periplasmic protein n=1 Tax=Chromobacterium sp. IIBBL 290-4 TaxID=2953890 RepID=UPI0020B640E9|nr:transporter substrate-binding domain-containing protein [Chromobacterium sp. IIBBL 290-4]UTH75700.1 transporter substrate-binding domain-containing protein [Chromobacterium sp. IIBBL 290-4]
MKKLIALLLLCLAGSALAAAPQPKRSLVFAYNAFPPWKYYDQQGLPAGPYTDLVRELARRMHLPLRFLHCPLPRCLAAMEQGRADLMIGVQRADDRSQYLEYLDPPFAQGNRLALYQRRDDPRDLSQYVDLLSLKVGVVEGVRYQEAFDNDPRIQRDAAPSIESNFRKLLAGRIDVLIGNEQQSGLLARRAEFAPQVRRAPLSLDDSRPHHLVLSLKSPYYAERTEFSKTLQTMLADGSVARILSGVPLQPTSATRPR